MFDSILNVAKDATRIVSAPVEIAADLTRGVTKPLADAAEDVVEEIKDIIEED